MMTSKLSRIKENGCHPHAGSIVTLTELLEEVWGRERKTEAKH